MIVTSAVIPARTVAGTFSSETVTAYETTPPVVSPAAVGAIAVTVPVTFASTAPIAIDAVCPTFIAVEVALDHVGRDLERRGVDDDRVAGRRIEPRDDVDLGDDAVDRGGQGGELRSGSSGRRASRVRPTSCVLGVVDRDLGLADLRR